MHFLFVNVCKQKQNTKNMSFQSPMPNHQFLWDVFQRLVFVIRICAFWWLNKMKCITFSRLIFSYCGNFTILPLYFIPVTQLWCVTIHDVYLTHTFQCLKGIKFIYNKHVMMSLHRQWQSTVFGLCGQFNYCFLHKLAFLPHFFNRQMSSVNGVIQAILLLLLLFPQWVFKTWYCNNIHFL